jgi:hypothetical protein
MASKETNTGVACVVCKDINYSLFNRVFLVQQVTPIVKGTNQTHGSVPIFVLLLSSGG